MQFPPPEDFDRKAELIAQRIRVSLNFRSTAPAVSGPLSAPPESLVALLVGAKLVAKRLLPHVLRSKLRSLPWIRRLAAFFEL